MKPEKRSFHPTERSFFYAKNSFHYPLTNTTLIRYYGYTNQSERNTAMNANTVYEAKTAQELIELMKAAKRDYPKSEYNKDMKFLKDMIAYRYPVSYAPLSAGLKIRNQLLSCAFGLSNEKEETIEEEVMEIAIV